MPTQNPTLQAAIETVTLACRVARAVQHNLDRVRAITKDDRSPVTVADFAVQALIALELNRRLGAQLIVGEEQADQLRDPAQEAERNEVVAAVQTELPGATPDEILAAIDHCDHDGSGNAYWALDPIDGTKGFLRGQQYAIALGLIENGEVTLGVMGCPNLPLNHDAPLDQPDPTGMIYAARKGHGTWAIDSQKSPTDFQPVRIADEIPPGSLRICESVEKAHSKQSDSARILDHLAVAAAPVRLDSQCKYAVVARGQADAYLRLPTSSAYVEKIWDHAAGSLIATEAGALVTDITGSPLDFTHGPRLEQNRGIICAHPHIHTKIIEAVDTLSIGTTV